MGVRFFIFLLIAPLLSAGCGLFGELPQFQGSDTGLSEDIANEECRQASDCETPQNMEALCEQNQCTFECKAGFIDRDDSVGCECEIGEEVCDGVDNDCDGAVDNIFAGGQIDVGRAHSCATTAAGEIYCWGANASGQLGLGTTALQSSPKRLPASDDIQAVTLSVGADHSCVIDETSRQIYCWGADADGQLGNDGTENKLVPTAIISENSFKEISAGEAHTCAIRDDDQALCWGDNGVGQLGTGGTDAASVPTEVADTQTFITIAAGATHTCALTGSDSSRGPAYCWGSNVDGQLGIGNDSAQLTPVGVDSAKAFENVTAGQNSSCARTSGNEVYCWGDGALSPARLTHPDTGEEVDFGVVSVGAAGTLCGVLPDGSGTVHCGDAEGWRDIADFDFVDIATAYDHTCAISDNGRIYCWGANAYGQVGNNSTGGTVNHPAGVACN